MKRYFKNLLAIVAVSFAVQTASADTDKPITVQELPVAAQQLIKKNFAKHQVSLAKMESDLLDKSYNVYFTNGDNLEFDRKGNWTEIVCKQTGVPVELVPQAITNYLKTSQPNAKVVRIERERSNYEVDLSNGFEFTFNKKFQVVDIDN